MYKHIIWDFDGTLFDTYEVMGRALQLSFQKIGVDEKLEDIISLMKISITEALQFYIDKYRIGEEFIKEYEKTRREMELDQCRPYPGVLDILKEIKEIRRYNYLFTHRGVSSIAFLQKHQIYDYFTDCITSAHSFERKPSPAAILHLVERYHMNPQEAIMIGDRDLDILSARNAGIKSCFFDEAGIICGAADYNISHIIQLFEII
ncbi:MAG: putative phosphatase [Firmicutes bacterium]|nr:putative phosphatase [Bacillota bacterium]